MDNTQLIIAIAIAVALVVAWKQGMLDSLLSKNKAYVAPSIDDRNALLDAIKNTDHTISDALTSGTGDPNAVLILYPGRFEVPTPGGGYGGWDLEDKAQDPVTPNKPDGSVNFIYREDYTFYRDQDAAEGSMGPGVTVTDLDGAKQIPLAHQSVGGAKQYYFQSFKVAPGTMIMITAKMRSSSDAYGFILRGRDCRDVVKLLEYYPELTGGNNGIFWEGWPNWDITWTVSALNRASFHKFLGRKFNGCLDTALGISNEGENAEMGLHYQNGDRIVDPSGANGGREYGRFVFDQNCNPVIDPGTGKQAYRANGSGWGYSCDKAYEFCALDTGTLVGVKLDQFDINEKGIPAWIGIDDVAGGVSKLVSELLPGQVGWVAPTSGNAIAPKASLLLSNPLAWAKAVSDDGASSEAWRAVAASIVPVYIPPADAVADWKPDMNAWVDATLADSGASPEAKLIAKQFSLQYAIATAQAAQEAAEDAALLAAHNTEGATSGTSQTSRFCDRSKRSEEYGDSVEDRMHHSGYSQFTANSLSSRYKTSLS